MKPPRPAPRRRKSLTVADLAGELALSPMTVSRALRGLPSVSSETQNRVLQLARSRGMEVGPPRQSGERPVVFHMPELLLLEPDQLPFWSRLYFLFKKNLAQMGLPSVAVDLDNGMGLGEIDRASVVAIFYGMGPAGAKVLKGLKKEVPVVGVLEGTLPCHIGVDHRGASEELAGLIAQGGHQHVAVFGIPGFGVDSRASCLHRSLLMKLPGVRVDFVDCPYLNHPRERQDGFMRQTLCKWLGRTDALPTVFYATDAHVALAAWRFFRQDLGMAIPQGMGLVGFDHSPVYDHLEPEMTRIGFDVGALARLAADQVFMVAKKGVASPGGHEVRAQYVPGRSVLPLSAMRPRALKDLYQRLRQSDQGNGEKIFQKDSEPIRLH